MMADLQIVLNKALQIATQVRKIDRVSVRELCERAGTLTINRICARDQLQLVWKSLHDTNSPLQELFTKERGSSSMTMRSKARGDLKEYARTTMGQRNTPHTVIKLWNKYGPQLRIVQSESAAKKVMKSSVLQLPM